MDAVEIIVRLEQEKIEIREKALVAYEVSTNKILTVGNGCEKYVGYEGVNVVSPLEEGKIADFTVAVALFRVLLDKAYKETGKKPLMKKRVGICTGVKLNEVERKAFEECIQMSTKPREVYICEKNYEKMLEGFEVFQVPQKQRPEVVFEIGGMDLKRVVSISVKKIMDMAKEQGIEKTEVVRMIQEALE